MRTTSPSSSVTGRPPISISLVISALAIVDLPEPESPVKKTVKPWFAARRLRLPELLHHGREGEPVGDLQPLLQPPAQLGAGDVEDGHPLLDLVARLVLRLLLDVDHLLEVDHLDPDLVLVLAEELLRLVGPVERIALRVLPRTGVVAPDDHVGAAVIAPDDPVPHRLARPAHAHGEVEEAERGGRGRILVEHRLVAAHAGEMVDVARLGHADDGWMMRFACASRAARKVSSWCARCSGLRVWKATIRRQPSLRK